MQQDTTCSFLLPTGETVLFSAEDQALIGQYRWRKHGRGYVFTSTSRKLGPRKHILLHRLIMQAGPGQEVDHKNHNKMDNRRENLRFASRAENCQNTPNKGVPSTSRFKGIWFDAARSKWRAEIKCNGKKLYVGIFQSEIDAAKAYDRKALELHGEFAALNFPSGHQATTT